MVPKKSASIPLRLLFLYSKNCEKYNQTVTIWGFQFSGVLFGAIVESFLVYVKGKWSQNRPQKMDPQKMKAPYDFASSAKKIVFDLFQIVRS